MARSKNQPRPAALRLVGDVTLSAALAEVVREARRDGLVSASVRGGYLSQSRAILRFIDGDTRLADLDEDAVRDFVRRALDAGLAPATVKRHYLRVLARAFLFANIESPVHTVTSKMRARLRAKTPTAPYFSRDELFELLNDIAVHCGRWPYRTRQRDLAIFRIVAYRALRTNELCRIRIERDIDFERGIVLIHSKDAGNPRTISLSDRLVKDVRVLMGDRTEGPLVLGGARTCNVISERWSARLGRTVNLRALRHSCATALGEQGATFASIGEVLGHVRGSTRTGLYVHPNRRQTEEHLRALERRVPLPPALGGSPPPHDAHDPHEKPEAR